MKLSSLVNKKKRVINCHDRAEMERLHDHYIEMGLKAEEVVYVVPFSENPIYRLIVEECA